MPAVYAGRPEPALLGRDIETTLRRETDRKTFKLDEPFLGQGMLDHGASGRCGGRAGNRMDSRGDRRRILLRRAGTHTRCHLPRPCRDRCRHDDGSRYPSARAAPSDPVCMPGVRGRRVRGSSRLSCLRTLADCYAETCSVGCRPRGERAWWGKRQERAPPCGPTVGREVGLHLRKRIQVFNVDGTGANLGRVVLG